MNLTSFQQPELRDANDNIVQSGTYGKNTAFCNSQNTGILDYVNNDLQVIQNELNACGVDTSESGAITIPGSIKSTLESYKTACSTSATTAGQHATNAATSETNAATSATNAATSEENAKTYAEQAMSATPEGYADLVSTVSTHSTDIAYNRRHIDYLWKANEGISYNFEDDTESANPKTVPSGSLACTVNKVGGKSIVWNQLANDTVKATTTFSGFTATYNNGVYTLSGTSDGGGNFNMCDAFSLTKSHKYYVGKCNITQSPLGEGNIRVYDATNEVIYSNSNKSNIFLATYNTTMASYYLNYGTSGVTLSGTFSPMVVDLTLMFGSGNEPSTVAEFEAMFPNDYYAYNAGEVISYSADNVNVQGKNLWDLNGYILANSSASVKSNGLIELSSSQAYAGIKNAITLAKGTYTVSAIFSNNTNGNTVSLNFADLGESAIILDVFEVSNNTSGTLSKTFTLTDTMQFYARFYCNMSDNVVASGCSVYLQIEKGSTATSYSPYTENTYTIPSSCTSLEGYGWSAGEVYNYVDFENKQYVQNVGRVDLGTLTWRTLTTYIFYAYLGNKYTKSSYEIDNLLCSKYTTMFSTQQTFELLNKTISGTGSDTRIIIEDTDYTDASILKSALSGVYLYYELATPVVTDISDILDDFAVEGNGTLTFVDTDNTDKMLPIPNEEEYVVKVSEVAG